MGGMEEGMEERNENGFVKEEERRGPERAWKTPSYLS
jgi:hypothetical protein